MLLLLSFPIAVHTLLLLPCRLAYRLPTGHVLISLFCRLGVAPVPHFRHVPNLPSLPHLLFHTCLTSSSCFFTQVWLGVTDSDTPGWWYWAATLENPDVEGDFNIWSPDSTKASAGANGEGINCIATDVNLNVNYGESGGWRQWKSVF